MLNCFRYQTSSLKSQKSKPVAFANDFYLNLKDRVESKYGFKEAVFKDFWR